MNKKFKSLLAMTLVAGFLFPATLFNNKTKNTQSNKNINTCFMVEPPSLRD